tara:strand:- start:953 stop:1303 length:351 start_codon:yes stop_codon:yes gene_type:complete
MVTGVDPDGVTISGVYSSKEKAIEEINMYFFDKLVKLGAKFKGKLNDEGICEDIGYDFIDYMYDDYIVMHVADAPYQHWKTDKWFVPSNVRLGNLVSEQVHIARTWMNSNRVSDDS